MAFRPWWMGRVNAHPPTLVMMRGMASVTGATVTLLISVVYTGLRKAEAGRRLVSFLMDRKERCQVMLLV